MAFYTVNDLKGALKGNGAMSNKYSIIFGVPSGDPSLALGPDAPILCMATSFPGKSIGDLEAWIQGRKLILPGDTSYGNNEWTLTFYQNADHELRKMFLAWMDKIDNFITNSHTCDPSSLMIEADIAQLACESAIAAKYKFYNMYPSAIGEIELNSESAGSVQKFSVTMKYSHWDSI